VAKEQLPAGVKFTREADGIKEYSLSNGMKVLLVENKVAPVATFLVLYKVGSRNEAVGYTGSTHLLEHMLFKGTPTFNIEKNTQIAATLQKIGAEFNATTWYDRTNYFESVPSDQLELAIKLEADRMRNSFIADSDRQSEMTVVRNELERGQNEPSIVLDAAVYATAFVEHPYHHPTIGWRADVENVPTGRLKIFYDTFYHPNNATAIVVGDFEINNALSLVNKYFGAYPASNEPIPEVYTDEPPQQGERRLVIRRAGELAIVQIAYHIPSALGQNRVLSNEELSRLAEAPPEKNDIYPLVVLSFALSNGITSRLYQKLVEKQLAVNVSTNADQFRDPGLFNVYVTVNPGVEPQTVEQAILSEMERVASKGLTSEEIERAKKQILALVAYNRDGTYNIAIQIGEAEAVADWRFYKDYAKNIAAVKAEDILRVCNSYFSEDNRTVGCFIPKQIDEAAISGNGLSSIKSGVGAARMWNYYDDPQLKAEMRGPTSAKGASGSAGGATGSNLSKSIRRVQLENQSVALLLENHATPTVSVRGSLLAGSHFEPKDKPGIAHICAQMLERGTKHRSKLQLASDLESVGAQIDFSSDPFALNIAARSISDDLPLVLNILSEMLREPAFPADELEKLKLQTVASIQEQQANTRYRAYERFTQMLFDPNNPFYVPPGERHIESISSLTVEDIRSFYEQRYGGRTLALSIVGSFDLKKVEELFRKSFETFNGPEDIDVNVLDPEPFTTMNREVVMLKEKANVDILLGCRSPLRRDARDYYAALLANSALGESTLSSRLGLQVRDREGLTYGIGSRFRAPSLAAGPWYIAVSVNPDNVEKAINSSLNVLRDYVEKGIRPEELEDEKSSAIGSFKVSLSTNSGLAEAIWNAEFYKLGLDYLDNFPKLINSVTIDEANSAIRKYFNPECLTVVIAGDYEISTASEAPTA
jgi:zinc protease